MSNISPAEPTRFPNGISTNQDVENLGQYALQDPTQWHSFFDDFDHYRAADWVITNVGTPTQALADEDGGALLLTNSAADDDSTALQSVAESFKFETGKKLFFKVRLKINDVIQSVLTIGLVNRDTTPTDVDDGVFFTKSDTSPILQLAVEKNDVATTTPVLTMANDTYVDVGFFYNGNNQIRIYSGNSFVAASGITNLPDDEELLRSIFVENGEAVAKNMSIDYMFIAKER